MKKTILILIIFALTLSVKGQRIRDLVNQATPDTLVYCVIDKAGWTSYKKIRADVLVSSAISNVSTTFDSLRNVLGFTVFSYVPHDSAEYITTADFTRLGYDQNLTNVDYIIDQTLDSVADVLASLKVTGTYKILNGVNEIGSTLAGTQYKTNSKKFVNTGSYVDGAKLIVTDTVNSAINYAEVDTNGYFNITKIAHCFSGFEDLAYSLSLNINTWTNMVKSGGLFVKAEEDGVTFDNDTITLSMAGDYAGTLALTFSGTNNNEYQFRIWNLTDARQEGFIQGGSAVTSNLTQVTLPIYIEADSANTEFVIQAQNISGSNACIFKHGQINLTLLHK